MLPRNQSSMVRGGTGMPDLPALFNELVRFEIELWNAVDARLRADCGLLLSEFEPMQVVSRRTACRVLVCFPWLKPLPTSAGIDCPFSLIANNPIHQDLIGCRCSNSRRCTRSIESWI